MKKYLLFGLSIFFFLGCSILNPDRKERGKIRIDILITDDMNSSDISNINSSALLLVYELRDTLNIPTGKIINIGLNNSEILNYPGVIDARQKPDIDTNIVKYVNKSAIISNVIKMKTSLKDDQKIEIIKSYIDSLNHFSDNKLKIFTFSKSRVANNSKNCFISLAKVRDTIVKFINSNPDSLKCTTFLILYNPPFISEPIFDFKVEPDSSFDAINVTTNGSLMYDSLKFDDLPYKSFKKNKLVTFKDTNHNSFNLKISNFEEGEHSLTIKRGKVVKMHTFNKLVSTITVVEKKKSKYKIYPAFIGTVKKCYGDPCEDYEAHTYKCSKCIKTYYCISQKFKDKDDISNIFYAGRDLICNIEGKDTLYHSQIQENTVAVIPCKTKSKETVRQKIK